MELLYFKKSIAYEIIQHALGIKTKVMQDCVPENAQPKVIFNSRIFVAIWIAIILWSLITLSWLPVLFFLLPKFYGRTLHKLVSFTQHAGLARDIKDQLPRTNDGLIDAYKEILPALMRQREDSSYFFKKEIPEPQNA